jgi:hypothetical protein
VFRVVVLKGDAGAEPEAPYPYRLLSEQIFNRAFQPARHVQATR